SSPFRARQIDGRLARGHALACSATAKTMSPRTLPSRQLARRVRRVQRGLLSVDGDRAEGIAGTGGVGAGVVVARAGDAVVAEARDIARRARGDADPVVARGEFHWGGEGEVIPAGQVRALEGELFAGGE